MVCFPLYYRISMEVRLGCQYRSSLGPRRSNNQVGHLLAFARKWKKEDFVTLAQCILRLTLHFGFSYAEPGLRQQVGRPEGAIFFLDLELSRGPGSGAWVSHLLHNCIMILIMIPYLHQEHLQVSAHRPRSRDSAATSWLCPRGSSQALTSSWSVPGWQVVWIEEKNRRCKQ